MTTLESAGLFIAMVTGVASVITLFLIGLTDPFAWEDHTHKLQDGAVVCIEGLGVVDYNRYTERPFLLCGVIEVREEGPSPSQPHLTQP